MPALNVLNASSLKCAAPFYCFQVYYVFKNLIGDPMRAFFSIFLTTLLLVSLVVNDASAKRFGGGRSFGVYRTNKSFSSTPSTQNRFMKNTKNTQRFGGLLGGLLIGGLLASLFMNNGIASGLLSWFIVGALLLAIMNFFKRRQAFQTEARPYAFEQTSSNNNTFAASSKSLAPSLPSGFDSNEFLRQCKASFIRLQAAYDEKNMDDLRAFTTPQVFAEISLQLQEREELSNVTDIIKLDAEYLGTHEDNGQVSASVKFSGVSKEDADLPIDFCEIWHFTVVSGSGEYLVSGVQQYNPNNP